MKIVRRNFESSIIQSCWSLLKSVLLFWLWQKFCRSVKSGKLELLKLHWNWMILYYLLCEWWWVMISFHFSAVMSMKTWNQKQKDWTMSANFEHTMKVDSKVELLYVESTIWLLIHWLWKQTRLHTNQMSAARLNAACWK